MKPKASVFLIFIALFALSSSCGSNSGELKPGVLLYKCNRDEFWACNNLGVAYSEGRGVAQSNAKAAQYFEKACTNGEALGCANVGRYYLYGIGVKADAAKATKYFQTACLAGYSDTCSLLADSYRWGLGITPNQEAANLYSQKACDGGHEESCFDLLINCSSGGDCNVSQEMVAALESKCSSGTGKSCFWLGSVYQDGLVDDPQAQSKAQNYYNLACNNDVDFCYKSGERLDGIEGGTQDACRAYDRACDNDRFGCREQAICLFTGRGEEKDQGEAIDLAEDYCESGNDNACGHLGAFLVVADEAADVTRGEALMQEACAKKEETSCHFLTLHALDMLSFDLAIVMLDNSIDEAKRKAIQRAIGYREGKMSYCYSRALEKGQVEGSIRLKLEIEKSGYVKNISLAEQSIDSDQLVECFMNTFKEIELPTLEKDIEFEYAMQFMISSTDEMW